MKVTDQEVEDMLRRIRKARVSKMAGSKANGEKLCARMDNRIRAKHLEARAEQEHQKMEAEKNQIDQAVHRAALKEKIQKRLGQNAKKTGR